MTCLWALRLEHPDLGTADLWCDRAAPPLAEFIEFANNLTDAEMAAGPRVSGQRPAPGAGQATEHPSGPQDAPAHRARRDG